MVSIEMLKKGALTATLAAAVSFGLVPTAGATLIGDTVTITSTANVPLDTWTDNVVVGAGAEMTGVENPALAPPYPNNGSAFQHTNAILGGNIFPHLFAGDSNDIGASSITINYTALGQLAIDIGVPTYAFQTIFSSLDFVGATGAGTLTNVTIAAGATGLLGQNISGISATGFTFQGTVDLVNGANFTLDMTVVFPPPPPPPPPPPTGSPEPTTLPLLATGLLVLIGIARRRRASRA